MIAAGAAIAWAAACTHDGGGGLSSGDPNGNGGSPYGGTGSSSGNAAGGATGGANFPDGSVAASDGAGGPGSGSQNDAPLSRGPTPPSKTSKFPFPQNRQKSHCIYPARYDNSVVKAAYAKWKSDLVVSAGAGAYRVQRASTDLIDTCRPLNSTVSEGIGYGMLAAVYMDDQDLFDGLWIYEQQNLRNGLMNWAPQGSDPNQCSGGATDADEDMAFALVMADAQWGGQGRLSQPYKQVAMGQIAAVWDHEIYQSKYIDPWDNQSATCADFNPSYLSPAYYRLFQSFDTDSSHKWGDALQQAYASLGDALTNGNDKNGLVPAWCDDSSAGACIPGGGGRPGNYQYDSCRTPFRIALDWCWNGEVRAQAYLAKTSSFFSAVGAANIADGYQLDGAPAPQNPGRLAASFVGPAGVGAMSAATYQSFLDDAYGEVASGRPLAGGIYYDESWMVMSLLMMTGNFINYASP